GFRRTPVVPASQVRIPVAVAVEPARPGAVLPMIVVLALEEVAVAEFRAMGLEVAASWGLAHRSVAISAVIHQIFMVDRSRASGARPRASSAAAAAGAPRPLCLSGSHQGQTQHNPHAAV